MVVPEDGLADAGYRPSSGPGLWLATLRMRWAGRGQRSLFRSLSSEAKGLYASLREHDSGPYVTGLWRDFNARLEGALLPAPPWDFLRNSTIKRTMFVDARGAWLESQARYLLSRLRVRELQALLPDEPVGDPPLAWARFGASHNSVHHLTHVERYREATGVDAAAVSSVVEWGGGYGNLARLIARAAELRGQRPPTYWIVDTPLLCMLQWMYLRTVFGSARVQMIGNEGAAPREGAFNILPVGLVERVRPRGELFVSTWALSESSVYAQDLVARDWFGAGRLLLAAQESSAELPHARRVAELAAAAGARVIPVPELPGNCYCFK
jgi:hypothetical protein